MKKQKKLNIEKEQIKIPLQIVKWSIFNKDKLIEKKIFNRNIITSYHYEANTFYLLFLTYVIKQNYFSGKEINEINRKTFITYGKLLGLDINNLKSIWLKGFVKNKDFLRSNSLIDENEKYIKLIKNKEIKYFIYVDNNIASLVFGLNKFKQFVSSTFSVTNTVIENKKHFLENVTKIKKNEELYDNQKKNKIDTLFYSKIRSKTYATIGRETGNNRKSAINRIKKFKKLLKNNNGKDLYKIKQRYEKINGYIVRKSNLYQIEGIKQVRNKNVLKNKIKQKSKEKSYYINMKNINCRKKNIYVNFLTYNQEKAKIKNKYNFKLFNEIKKVKLINKNINELKEKCKEFIKNGLKNIKFQKIQFLQKFAYENYNLFFKFEV